MSKLLDIISRFSDREFAFFIKYRLPEFSDPLKEKIYLELKRRQLSKDLIISLLDTTVNEVEGNCKRCNSDSFFTETRTESVKTGMSGYEIDVNSYRCIVCGYNDDIDGSIWNKGLLGQVSKWLG